MFEKLDFLVRFWQLKARHATCSSHPAHRTGDPLSLSEQRELLGLLQLVTTDLPIPRPGKLARTGGSMPAQVIGDGAIRPVEIRAVMAGSLLVTSLTGFDVGASLILRAADAVLGVEYSIPCKVQWSYSGAPHSMALVIDGVPTRSDFEGARPTSTLLSQRHERLVG